MRRVRPGSCVNGLDARGCAQSALKFGFPTPRGKQARRKAMAPRLRDVCVRVKHRVRLV